MKLWVRLIVAGLAGALAAVFAAAAYALLIDDVMKHETGTPSAEMRERIVAEEIADAKLDALRFAKVLVPLAMGIAWWMPKKSDVARRPKAARD